jgi:hypothetical protein
MRPNTGTHADDSTRTDHGALFNLAAMAQDCAWMYGRSKTFTCQTKCAAHTLSGTVVAYGHDDGIVPNLLVRGHGTQDINFSKAFALQITIIVQITERLNGFTFVPSSP